MSFKLVVSEKYSVAESLSRVIGATKRRDGYYEGNGYLVTWCVGHLVDLSPPERYNELRQMASGGSADPAGKVALRSICRNQEAVPDRVGADECARDS